MKLTIVFFLFKNTIAKLYVETKVQCFHVRFDFRLLQQHTAMNSRGKVSIYLFGRFLFKAGRESQTVPTTHFLLNGQLEIVPNY